MKQKIAFFSYRFFYVKLSRSKKSSSLLSVTKRKLQYQRVYKIMSMTEKMLREEL